jgi:predicted dehydrogenase
LGIRWGILATGWIADLFVKDMQMEGRTVAAVGSRSQSGADGFARRFGIPRAHGSYEALCTDPAVDVVYVATPHPMHAANAKLALEHGKHVLMEKPFTINAREAQEIVDLAKSRNLVVLEAMWTRFLPYMVRVREILAAGTIGEIRTVIADHTQDLPDDPTHRLNALELGGGALLDLGIYPISFTYDVLGPPSTVHSAVRKKETGADGTIATVFGYDSGATAVTVSCSDAAGPNTASVIGTNGRIDIGRVWYQPPTTVRVYDSKHNLIETIEGRTKGRGMQFQAFEMERLIKDGGRESTILPPAQTVAIMRTLDTIRAQIGLRYPTE